MKMERMLTDWVQMDAPELRIVSGVLWEQVAKRHRKNEAAYLRGAHGQL